MLVLLILTDYYYNFIKSYSLGDVKYECYRFIVFLFFLFFYQDIFIPLTWTNFISFHYISFSFSKSSLLLKWL